jgi:DtxR family transcriptional regulator, Mn-dependent transcriptional regulator
MRPTRQPLSSSLEDYLEAVLELVQTGRVARVRDIARRLNVGMPSVSVALKTLSARGLVNYDPYQVITLTERGEQLGRDITHRHEVLQGFLTDVLGIAPEVAQSNACRMEHAIDNEVLEKLKEFAGLLRRCPRVVRDWAGQASPADGATPQPADCPGCDASPRTPAAGERPAAGPHDLATGPQEPKFD